MKVNFESASSEGSVCSTKKVVATIDFDNEEATSIVTLFDSKLADVVAYRIDISQPIVYVFL